MFKGEAVKRVENCQRTPINHEGVHEVAEQSSDDKTSTLGLLVELEARSSEAPQTSGPVEQEACLEVEVDPEGLEARAQTLRLCNPAQQTRGRPRRLAGTYWRLGRPSRRCSHYPRMERGLRRLEKAEDKDALRAVPEPGRPLAKARRNALAGLGSRVRNRFRHA